VRRTPLTVKPHFFGNFGNERNGQAHSFSSTNSTDSTKEKLQHTNERPNKHRTKTFLFTGERSWLYHPAVWCWSLFARTTLTMLWNRLKKNKLNKLLKGKLRISIPLAATSVQMRNLTCFCLKASRLSRRSCGFRSECRHTHENFFLSMISIMTWLNRYQEDKERRTFFHTNRVQVLFEVITINFSSAEDNCLVHFMFSYGPDAIFSL
jgi:hypothetical protein